MDKLPDNQHAVMTAWEKNDTIYGRSYVLTFDDLNKIEHKIKLPKTKNPEPVSYTHLTLPTICSV